MRVALRDALRRLRLVSNTLKLIRSAAPLWCAVWAFLLLIQGLIPAAIVYLTRPVTNALVQLVRTDFAGPVLREFLILAGLYALTLWLMELIGSTLSGVRSVQAELVQDHITDRIHQHAIEADLAFYESPEYHDQLHRARDQASSRSLSLLENVGEVIQGTISLIAIAAILITYGAAIGLLLLVSAIPGAAILIRFQWLNHRFWMDTTTERRWTGYYDAYLTSEWAAEEQRLFGWGPAFRSNYRTVRQGLRTERFRLIRKQTIMQGLATTVALLAAGGAGAWMLWRISLGMATLGDLALFYSAFSQAQGRLRVVLTGGAQIFSNLLFVESLYDVLNLKPTISSPEEPQVPPSHLVTGIRFRGVSFRYPGSAHRVLDGFDLFIPAGKTIAIVGTNGAGKTTLTKLLCRFYDPEEGCIEMDGRDIRSYSVADLRRLITVLFQKPVSYAATVEANIGIGDLRGRQSPEAVARAARSAGAHRFIDKLPKGYQTMLGKIFPGGVNLSGGQTQQVALARAFFRDSPIVVLDEPTSFMDSWAEIEWHSRFRRFVEGKTVLMITHRFTTAMRADLIYVMKDGRICEQGSHTQLLEQQGLYAESWRAQITEPSAPDKVAGI